MRKMKDSGVPWIGEIPENWTVKRIGICYAERNEKVSDKDYPPLSVTKFGVFPQLESAAKTDNGDNRKHVCVGDFVINSRSDRKGSCGISSFDGSVSLINIVLIPIYGINNNYFSFVFKSSTFSDEFYKWGNGIVDDLWSTKWQSMKKIFVPFPSFPEQQRIADYLDTKCAQIDATIVSIHALIDKLKEYKQSVITEAVTKGLDPDVPMKDSGVPWIGEIPEGWEIQRLKNICTIYPGVNIDINFDAEVSFLPMENIKNGYFVDDIVKKISEYTTSYNIFKDNDIILAKVTPCFENGNIAIVDNLKNGIGFGTSEIFVIRVNNACNKFIFYYFQNELFRHRAIATMTGAGGLKRISSQFMRDENIFLPSLPEQQRIAAYLDDKCARIDAVLADKQALLDTLAEYKKSLIFECVTGKREVPA